MEPAPRNEASGFDLSGALRAPYFSWANRAPLCPPSRQGKCQSCFAISAVQCLEDRYTIAYKLKHRLRLSAMYALQCYEDHRRLDCASGGYALELCKQLETLGTVSAKCWPDEKIRELGKCPEHVWGAEGAVGCCAGGCGVAGEAESNDGSATMPAYTKYYARPGSSRIIRYFGKNERVNVRKTVEAVAFDVRSNGPVVACFQVTRKLARALKMATSRQDTPPPFGSPAAVVYEPPRAGTRDDEWISAHSASITGWVIDSRGRRFWQVRNSGSKGPGGYLYMLSSEDYPNGARRIGLDAPILIKRSAAHGWVHWGGSTTLTAGDLNHSVRSRVYANALMACGLCAAGALVLLAWRRMNLAKHSGGL